MDDPMTRGYAKVEIRLNSWRDAQRQEKAILALLHADPHLMLAAASNPLFALEELGYQIDEGLKQEFEDRLRFGSGFEQMAALRKKIFDLAGKPFELNSAESLHTVLAGLLEKKVLRTLTLSDTAPLHALAATNAEIADPLERIRDAHPIMKPLLQYRRADAGAPPFATRQVYQSIRGGERAPSVKDITIRPKKLHK
jgi:DNA polymerase I-like protein with 3'-5' exonuclease and polymerase domains